MDSETAVILWFLLGAILSVVLPYARAYFEESAPFEWRKLVGQLIAVAAVIAGQVIGISEQLTGATAVVAFAAGMGASYMGRQGQKAVVAIMG